MAQTAVHNACMHACVIVYTRCTSRNLQHVHPLPTARSSSSVAAAAVRQTVLHGAAEAAVIHNAVQNVLNAFIHRILARYGQTWGRSAV
jgi:hypothetical protein